MQEFQCFRSAFFNESEKTTFSQNIGKYIENLDFLSISKSQNMAGDFMKNIRIKIIIKKRKEE